MSSPKTFQQILESIVGAALKQTSVSDLNAGSVMKTLLDSVEDIRQKENLLKFLQKLDSRFKLLGDPWSELKIAQRYYSRP